MISSSWTAGYVAELEYTHGYFRELSPAMMDFALVVQMYAGLPSRPLRYLELGYGQGLSVNIHAAGRAGEYWGTDFNPAQAANAQSLAQACGSGAVLLDDSFEELAARPDLPVFDVIALHGIWSWISDQNRRVIVDLVHRKLAVGGVLYISYNCLPGWAPALPLRHLLTLHADAAGSDAQGLAGRIDAALAFAQRVVDSGAAYFKVNPGVAERLKKISEQNRNYLAHEYFNRDWHPMHFSELAEMFSEAKLTHAASANLLDHFDVLNLTPDAQKLLGELKHPVLRESVRDYVVGQQFRKDLFVKGPRRLSPLQQRERLERQHFVLTMRAADVPMKVKGALGDATLQENVYRPVLDALEEDGGRPQALARLVRNPRLKDLQYSQIVQALTILIGADHAGTAQDPEAVSAAKARTDALNAHLMARARSSADVAYLASPVTGEGVAANRIQQLFLLALGEGRKTPEEWAKHAWAILSAQGHRLRKDDKPLETMEDNIAELLRQANEFETKRLPVLRALGIC
jgi:hypothetical protein